MTNFQHVKKRFQERLKRLADGSTRPLDLLSRWTEVITPKITSLDFSFDPRKIDDYYGPDETVFSKRFFLFSGKYLKQCCASGPDCLAGETTIPIGGIDDSDELLYLHPDLRVSILHHDDVYGAEDLDAVVTDFADHIDVSVDSFVDALVPETDQAKFSVKNNAAELLVIERVNRSLLVECNVSDLFDDGEYEFESEEDARADFFSTIQSVHAKHPLSMLSCARSVRKQLDRMLH